LGAQVNLSFAQDGTIHSIDQEEKCRAFDSNCGDHDSFAELKDFLNCEDPDLQEDTKGSSDSRCLHEMLEEYQSDSPVSFYSHLDSSEESDNEVIHVQILKLLKILQIVITQFGSPKVLVDPGLCRKMIIIPLLLFSANLTETLT
jgi:hypothetical protein